MSEERVAGVFKVPVNNALYRFVFPDNAERTVVCTPPGYTVKERNDCRSIEINQTPLRNATFEITFSPRIVDAESSISSRVAGVGVAIAVLGMISIAIVAVVKKAKRANWGNSDSSSWWSAGSSCAGGSSCSSSSSGSSCGGGGGCGGGGCGGCRTGSVCRWEPQSQFRLITCEA